MKDKLKKILPIVVLIIITIAISLLSYANPFTSMKNGTDANVFEYMVNGMNNGEVPYKDMFDHKGPLFFFINWIGSIINIGTIKGIWLCQVIAIFLAVLFTQKTLKKKFNLNEIEACVLNFLVNINLIYFLDEGNLVELYAYSAISVALYFMLTLENENLKKYSFIIGILIAVVISLKANMIIMWIAFYLVLLMVCIKRKKIKKFAEILGYSILGALSFGTIIVVYLLIKGALIDCLKDYILFNFKYSTMRESDTLDVLKFFIKDSNTILYIVIIASYIINIKRNKSLNLFAIISFLLSWIIIAQPGNKYYHYAMMIVPTFTIPLANIYIWLKEPCKNKRVIWIVIAILTIAISYSPIIKYGKNYVIINNANYVENENIVQIGEYIKNNSAQKDKMLVIGNDCSYYLAADRRAASKYMYQFPICMADKNIIQETISDINDNLPKYIVILKYQVNNELVNGVTNNIKEKYKEIQQNKNCKLYERESK